MQNNQRGCFLMKHGVLPICNDVEHHVTQNVKQILLFFLINGQ